MKSFAERNQVVVGAMGLALTAGLLLAALEYDKLPFYDSGTTYTADFAEAGGLRVRAPVQVSGFRVGEVSSIELEGSNVVIKFHVDRDVELGERTEAAIKTRGLLGAKVLEITPRGDGTLGDTIPIDRTTPPYQLPDALGDLSSTISGLNTTDVSDALATLAQTFKETPPELQVALNGVARFSQTLDNRDSQLRNLLANANKATGVLAERSSEVVGLVHDTNNLLAQLQTQSAALDEISGNLSAFATQVSGLIADNRQQIGPALQKINGALTLIDNRKERIQKAIKGLNAYAMSLGESIASGPFFKSYVVNLLPGQFIQPFIDAAFSDLGLDPNVLLPSQRTDPPTGQPGTPALPVPYPRTGQGGEPNLNLPDAITGNPGDQGCGPPGLALAGPTGCYPYRTPLPAPPPGGPPPGPPAPLEDGSTPTPSPSPSPVFVPAPGEPPPAGPLPGPAAAGAQEGTNP